MPDEGIAVLTVVAAEVVLNPLDEGVRYSVIVALTPGNVDGVKGTLVKAVKFQSSQTPEGVSEHDVGCVILGQNSDDGMSVGIPPELPLAPDMLAVWLVVDVELSVIPLVVDAVALVTDDEVSLSIELFVFEVPGDDVIDDENESEVTLPVGCELESPVDSLPETAEMMDGFNHPVEDAEV